jgi:putative nucleotidyltransferase with HDIG domain
VSRDADLALVREYTASDSLIKHMLAVEAAMRAYARKFGEDEEKFGRVGLLHDFDYERWPDPPDHPLKGAEILQSRGYPNDVIYAIKSRRPTSPTVRVFHSSTKRSTPVTTRWFITRANSSVHGSKGSSRSVRKKLKQASFAAAINGKTSLSATDSSVDLDEPIAFCITAMQGLPLVELGLGPTPT